MRVHHLLLLVFGVALLAGLFLLASGRGLPIGRASVGHVVEDSLPDFSLPGLDGEPGLSRADFSGTPKMLNVFASWCLPCEVEAPILAELRKQGATVIGVAVRDQSEDIRGFLDRHGNAYEKIGLDEEGKLLRELGARGVPQTCLVDGKGVIRFVHEGEIRPEHVPALLARLQQLR